MRLLRTLSILLWLAALCAAQENVPQETHRKAADAELQRKADAASGAECAQLSMRAARQSLEDADRLFRSGNTQAAHNAIDVSMYYARRSVECSLQSRKRQRAVEIELRGLIRRMNDVARTLDSEGRQQLTKAMAELDGERDRLLQAIFGPAAANSREKTQ